jgi:hypothetical protein
MSKNRYIDTKMWSDNYYSNLDSTEKLLFVYCLTNDKTNICGIYEIPLKYIAFETGIDKDMCEKLLKRFEKDNKIKYENGWLAIKNFIKHQDQGSPQVKKGIENELSKAPINLFNWIKGIDTLSDINSIESNLIQSNINSNAETSPPSNSKVYFQDNKNMNEIIEIYKTHYKTFLKSDIFFEIYGATEKESFISILELLSKANPEETADDAIFNLFCKLKTFWAFSKQNNDKSYYFKEAPRPSMILKYFNEIIIKDPFQESNEINDFKEKQEEQKKREKWSKK